MMNRFRGRLVKALGGRPPQKPPDETPRKLADHRLYPVLVAAAQRPVNLQTVQDQITALWREGTAAELEDVLDELLRGDRWRPLARNFFAAAVRVVSANDAARGVWLGEKYLFRIPDRRAIRSLVRPNMRVGNFARALALLELLEADDWVEQRRALVEKKFRRSLWRPEREIIRHPGYWSLLETPPPAILLYGDLNMNLIDGSSIWLASCAEALTGCGLDVHVLLKCDIERSLLLESLAGLPGLRLIEPSEAGLPALQPQEAIDVIEALDGLQGGYEHIVLRGTVVSNLAADRKSLWRRVSPYLTDFYRVDDDPPKLVIPDETRAWFADFVHLFERFFVQTPALADVMVKELGVRREQVVALPPLLPDALVARARPRAPRAAGRPFRIGYAGKLAPRWGVLELVATAEALATRGRSIEVHIIGDKIYDSNDDFPTFAEDVAVALASPLVTWHRGLSRSATMDAMADMDLAWCYRDPYLELHTLELSTKLLECMALGVPVFLLRSPINEQLLGSDYPLFVQDLQALDVRLEEAVDGCHTVDFTAPRWRELVRRHSIAAVRAGSIAPIMQPVVRSPAARKIVLAGHDLKFIGELESHLKRLGHVVRRDDWEWGHPADEARSRQLLIWADVVVCEWALANAVWYSERLEPGKRLVVRLHNQEVRQRGSVFPPKIAFDRVDAMVFVSDESRRRAVEMFGWGDDRLVTIPNFVNVDVLARPKSDGAGRTLAMVGVLPRLKRLDRALDLVAGLRATDPSFRLLVKGHLPVDQPWLASRPGEVPYFDEQLRRIETDPVLAAGVTLDPFEPRLATFYQDVGYVLSPSDLESFHYAVAEGAASGAVPIVWPWEGAELHYPADWIVKDGDEARDRILALAAAGEDERRRHGEACREVIRERYGLSTVLPRLTEVVLG
jgi:glycosyltransferase involved in cell wall biosynthesis